MEKLPISIALFSASAALGVATMLLVQRRISKCEDSAATPERVLVPFVYRQKNMQVEGEGGEDVHAPFEHQRISMQDMKLRAESFFALMNMRRSVRFFSSEDVSREVIDNCIRTAGTRSEEDQATLLMYLAHGWTHRDWPPWTHRVLYGPVFAMTPPVCPMTSIQLPFGMQSEIKAGIRAAVEEEEKLNYERRMNRKWVNDVVHLVDVLPTAYTKPYLTDAPYLIVVMKKTYDVSKEGEKLDVYYAEQSCGIASGFLIAALHNANLVTLTSTPMGAESKIRDLLGRGKNEKVFLLMPVGYPTKNATVPYRTEKTLRKPLEDIMSYH